MTQDDIIRMAHQAGYYTDNEDVYDGDRYGICTKEITKFANLVAAHERELCAKVCEEMHEPEDSVYHWIPDGRGALQYAASGIRARGEK